MLGSILIAEDEDRLAAFIAKGLKKNGYNTAIASNGQQAVELASSGHYDLLLLDLGLPVVNGLEVLVQLRQTTPSFPIIIVTARDDLQDRQFAQQYGVDYYITKPFSFRDLLENINNCLLK